MSAGIQMFRENRMVRLAIGAIAILVVLVGLSAKPGGAQAATPTILNTGNWLESTFSLGETNNSANRVWITLAVKHDLGRKVTGLKIDDDWDGTDNTSSKSVKAVTAQQPTTLEGGYDHSRISYNYAFPVSNTGMSCGAFGVGGTNKATKQIRVRAVLDNGEETATSTKDIIFTRADCSGGEDYPYIYSRSQSATSVTPGSDVTFTFRGDDSDSTGNADFAGINWRLRRVSDGATSAVTKRCYSSPFDNTDKTLTVNFPDRGRWVVEAELLNNSGCNINNNAGSWAYIGAVDVNTAAATSPTATLTATRPQIGGNTTVTASFADGSDSDEGGRVQNVEWDLNGDNDYELADFGSWNANLSSPRSKTVSTSGMTPGLKTVRVRVGDNGALVGADSIRRTKVATATYLVDTPPVATDQSVQARAGNAKEITLAGTDADSDTLTFAAVAQPTHGTLAVSGSTATYTPDVGYAGPDSFTFSADDGFGGTDTGTVDIEVAPQTTVDAPTPTAIAVDNAEFHFSSQAAGATFECRLDPGQGGDWEACESPYEATGLSAGPHVFQVRATASGITDPSPAEHTVTAYLTPPDTTIDSGPTGLTNQENPVFTFSSDVAGSTFECMLDFGDIHDWAPCTSPKTLEGLFQGAFTFSVRATDPAGNVDPDPAVRNFFVDLTPPDISLDSAPAAVTNLADAEFGFSSSDGFASFECSLDGAAWTDCDPPQGYSDLGEGEHTFGVRAVDEAGNRSEVPATHTWTVDRTDPTVVLDSTPDVITRESQTVFEFSADEEVTFECDLDGNGWASCDSPWASDVAGEGPHSFRVRATDEAGNTGLTPWFDWEIDTVAPETEIDAGPLPHSNVSSPEFEFSSNEAGATFECRIDSTDDADWATCASPKTFAGLDDGAHRVEVRATDPAGNVDQSPAEAEFTVDTIPPAVTIDAAPDAETGSPNAEFDFTAGGDDVTFECRLDPTGPDDGWEACESPKSYLGLADGNHRFEVRATDLAGNLSEVEFHTWSIDVTAPVTTITAKPADPTSSDQASFEFEADDAAAEFECRLDSTEESGWQACASPRVYTGLDESRHTFEVRGIDAFDNVAAEPAAWSWTVDRTAPTIGFHSGPPPLNNFEDVGFQFNTNEPADFECRFDSDQPGDWEGCDNPHQITGITEGDHVLEIRARDAAGNLSTTAEWEWSTDLTAPVVTLGEKPAQFTNQTSAAIEFSSESGVQFSCSFDGPGFDPCSSPATFTGLTEGEHTFRVRAEDPAGNVSQVESYSWRVILTPPEVSIDRAPGALSNAPAAEFEFSSNDAQATFECRLDSSDDEDFTSCASPRQVTGLADGEHVFEVRAIDGLGNISDVASHEWTVDLTAPGVSIDSGPSNLVKVDTAEISFSSGDPAATFECSVDEGSWSDCQPPVTLEDVTEGQHTFAVRATDPAGNIGSAQSLAWTVDLTAPVVTIDGAPDALVNSPTATFQFSADESGRFECRLDGADWSDCDSPLQYSDLTEGDHAFAVRITDAAGNESNQELHEWTVDLTAPEAAITSAPDALTNLDTAEFQFVTDDPDDSFECRIDSDDDADWDDCESPMTLENLTHGPHAFEVRATDRAGNTGPADSHEWQVDLEAPAVSITEAPATINNRTEAIFEFGSTDAGAEFECRIDAGQPGQWESCESPHGYGDLTGGSYTFRVKATDAAGNTGGEANHTWEVDLTAPVPTIQTGPSGTTRQTGAEFTFGADEAGATFECRIDSEDEDDYGACNSPQALTDLGDGSHKFDLRATDAAGNQGSTSREWTVDTVAPVATIDDAPPAATNQGAATFEFTSDKAGSTFQCRLDSDLAEDWQDCSSPRQYAGLADGAHTFEVKATDPLGNEGESQVHTWSIDRVLPVATITGAPGSPTASRSAEFTFTADKSGSSFECRIDGAGEDGWSPCDSGVAYTALADGEHRFEVRATDPLGNRGEPDGHEWTVDGLAPVATIQSGPPARTSQKEAGFEFTTDRPGTFQCRVDSDLDAAWESCSSPFGLSGLADGEHRFQVRSVGAVSGPGPVATRVWTVDTIAPSVAIGNGPSSPTRETGARFEFGSDDANATFSCRIDSANGGDWQSCESPRSYAGLPDGAHRFEVRVTDEAGNSRIQTHEWTIDTVAPVVTITSGPQSGTTDTAAEFVFSADKAGTVFECALDAGAWAACQSPQGVVDLSPGDHTFRVRGTDGLGNRSEAVSFAWKVTEKTVDPPAEVKPPAIKAAKRVRPARSGKAKLGTIACPEGTCTVKAPKKVTVKIGKARFKAKVKVARNVGAGKSTAIRVVLPGAARKALAKKGSRVKLKVTVTSSNGESVTRTLNVKLDRIKGGKKK